MSPTRRKGSLTVQFASQLCWHMDVPDNFTTERLLDAIAKRLDELSGEKKRNQFRELARELDWLAFPRRRRYRFCPLCEHLVLVPLEGRVRRRTCGRHTPRDAIARRRALAQLGTIGFFNASYETAASELGYTLEPWPEFVKILGPFGDPNAQLFKDVPEAQQMFELVMVKLSSILPKILESPPTRWSAQLADCSYPSLADMVESLANDMRQESRDGSMPSWAISEAAGFAGASATRALVLHRLLATRQGNHGGRRAGAGRPRKLNKSAQVVY